jgi:hypothetical protein
LIWALDSLQACEVEAGTTSAPEPAPAAWALGEESQLCDACQHLILGEAIPALHTQSRNRLGRRSFKTLPDLALSAGLPCHLCLQLLKWCDHGHLRRLLSARWEGSIATEIQRHDGDGYVTINLFGLYRYGDQEAETIGSNSKWKVASLKIQAVSGDFRIFHRRLIELGLTVARQCAELYRLLQRHHFLSPNL